MRPAPVTRRAPLLVALALAAGVSNAQPGPSPSAAVVPAPAVGSETLLKLGKQMLEGREIQRDPLQALTLLQKAAEQGQPEAACLVGRILVRGVVGVPKDIERGRTWLQRGMAAGRGDCADTLGYMDLAGDGLPRPDLLRAEWHFAEAIRLGHADSSLGMALTLIGTTAEPGRAPAEGVATLRLAAAQGSAKAAVGLHVMYATGLGVIRDDREAARWLMVAAERGNTSAQLLLASALRSGSFGLTRDPLEAYVWITVAANQGDIAANLARSNFEKELSPNEVADAQVRARQWKPETGPEGGAAGRRALAGLQILPRFETAALPGDLAGLLKSCIPSYPQTAIDRSVNAWKPLDPGTVQILSHKEHSARYVMARSLGTCLSQSEAGFPVYAAEAFIGTVEPNGVGESVRDAWFAEVARLIATKGFAEVVYHYTNGNAHVVLYKPQTGSETRIEYRMSFRKAGEFDASRYDKVFPLPENSSISRMEYGGRASKFILEHRFSPPRPPLPTRPGLFGLGDTRNGEQGMAMR